MAKSELVLQQIVKKWIEDYLAINQLLVKNKNYSQSDKDVFLYLAEIPANTQFDENLLNEYCDRINKLVSELPDQKLSTKLSSFSGYCSTCFKDKESFPLFCRLLNEKEAYRDRHKQPFDINEAVKTWFTLMNSILKSKSLLSEDAQSALMTLTLLPLDTVTTKRKSEESILVLQAFANEPSCDSRLSGQIKEFAFLCQNIYYDKEQYALFRSSLEKSNVLAALSKIKEEIEEKDRLFREEQRKEQERRKRQQQPCPKPEPEPQPRPEPKPNPKPDPKPGRPMSPSLKKIIGGVSFVAIIAFVYFFGLRNGSKPDTPPEIPTDPIRTEVVSKEKTEAKTPVSKKEAKSAKPSKQSVAQTSQPTTTPETTPTPTQKPATTSRPESVKPMNDKELVEAGTKAYRSFEFEKAIEYFEKAANNGQMLAQYNLAKMYLDGNGTRKNPQIAAQWFMKAAQQGDVASQCMIGKMYLNGQGVSKDEQQALLWLKKAADQGDEEAIRTLKRI